MKFQLESAHSSAPPWLPETQTSPARLREDKEKGNLAMCQSGSIVMHDGEAEHWPVPKGHSLSPGLETWVASPHSGRKEGKPLGQSAPISTGQGGGAWLRAWFLELSGLGWYCSPATCWQDGLGQVTQASLERLPSFPPLEVVGVLQSVITSTKKSCQPRDVAEERAGRNLGLLGQC